MKKMYAATELTVGELRQLDKQQAQQRRQLRHKDRTSGEKRIRPLPQKGRTEPNIIVNDDEEEIDLSRVKKLADLAPQDI
jgi:hypothetical protein